MWCAEAEWVLGFSLEVDVWINKWMNSIQCCILQGFLRGLLCSRLLYHKSILLNSLLSGNACLYNIQGEYPCITSPQNDWWEQQRHNYEGKVGRTEHVHWERKKGHVSVSLFLLILQFYNIQKSSWTSKGMCYFKWYCLGAIPFILIHTDLQTGS